jgi:L-iditol 2-dehydrogenase
LFWRAIYQKTFYIDTRSGYDRAKMKALVYTEPMKLELRDMSEPRLGAADVLIRVNACGICGSDLHGFLGKSKKRVPPLVLGHEFSGDVVERGSSSQFQVGSAAAIYPLLCCGECRYCNSGRENLCPSRRVFGLDLHGGLAEFVAVPEQCVFPLPDGMTHVEGALVEPLANALHVVNRIPDVRGATGLIYGAGPIGLLSLFAAKQAGAARVAVVDRNQHRLRIALELGAELAIDASQQDAVKVVQDWTADRHGVDFSVDAVGTDVCRHNAAACTAAAGTVVCIGLDQEICSVDTRPFVVRELDLRGVYAYTRKEFAKALEILASHKFPYQAFITTANIDAGQQIFEELAGGRSPIVKAVFLNQF